MIARCDRKGNILGAIERWEAHEKAVLHRAFTAAVIYDGKFLIQHRKHPVFDGILDVTSSSHQVYSDGILQDTVEATYECLKREWNIDKKEIVKIKDLGTVYYKAKDEFSIYTEHEICNVIICEVKKLPKVNYEVSYGYSLASKKDLYNPKTRLYKNLAPWVKAMIKENLL